jgi:hypothetical protein
MSIKHDLLLKKSYDVRKLMDILQNVPHIVILHVDNILNISLGDVRSEMKRSNVNSYLINKDDLLGLPIASVAKGTSLIFYSEIFFYSSLSGLLKKNNIKEYITLYKNQKMLSPYFKKLLLLKYSNQDLNVRNFFFFLLNFYKNLIYIYKYIIFSFFEQIKFQFFMKFYYQYFNLMGLLKNKMK